MVETLGRSHSSDPDTQVLAKTKAGPGEPGLPYGSDHSLAVRRGGGAEPYLMVQVFSTSESPRQSRNAGKSFLEPSPHTKCKVVALAGKQRVMIVIANVSSTTDSINSTPYLHNNSLAEEGKRRDCFQV